MAMTSAERQRERRKRLKEEDDKEILVRLDKDQLEALKAFCAKHGVTISHAVGIAIEKSFFKPRKAKKVEEHTVYADEIVYIVDEDRVCRRISD